MKFCAENIYSRISSNAYANIFSELRHCPNDIKSQTQQHRGLPAQLEQPQSAH